MRQDKNTDTADRILMQERQTLVGCSKIINNQFQLMNEAHLNNFNLSIVTNDIIFN